MKKVFVCLLCVLLLLPVFAGCAPAADQGLPTLSDEMKIKIAEDFRNREGSYNPNLDPIELWNPFGLLYYGHYAGYDIIGVPGQLTVFTEISIGKAVFTYSSSFSLLAYKDGTFESLKTLYDQSMQNGAKPLLTDQELEELLHIHQLHIQERDRQLQQENASS